MRWSPRVTVAAIIEHQNRFLLVEEKEGARRVISQPAGHLEKGESLFDAIVREVQEETAWQFTPQSLVGIYRWEHAAKGLTYLRFCYTGTVSNHNPDQPLDQGIIGTHWLTREEFDAAPLRSPIVRLCMEDYLAGQRYPLTICTDLSAAAILATQHNPSA